jgi:hypothetical protein
MMTTTAVASKSAISAERLHQAIADSLTYDQFAETLPKWRDEFDLNFEAVALEPEEIAALNALRPSLDALAIVEDWCPDVIVALPILARIEQDTGAIKLHVLIRPAHQDIADAYPHPDGRSHIPTIVFFDRAGEQRGVFIERPDSLYDWVLKTFRAVVAKQAGPEVDTSDIQKVPLEIKRAASDTLLRERRTVRDLERSELVKAILQAGAV